MLGMMMDKIDGIVSDFRVCDINREAGAWMVEIRFGLEGQWPRTR